MGINIAGGADIAVPQPLLNLLQAHAVGVKQACATMAQVVETDTLHVVRREKNRKMLREIIRVHTFSHRIHIDIVEIVRAIIFAAGLPVQRLLFLHMSHSKIRRVNFWSSVHTAYYFIQIAAAIYTQAHLRTSLFCFLLYQLSLWWVKYRAQPEAIST